MVGIVGLSMMLLSLLTRLSSSSLISFVVFWCFKFYPSSDEFSFIFPDTFGPITFIFILETLRETTHDTVFDSGTDVAEPPICNTFISFISISEAREDELLREPPAFLNLYLVLLVFPCLPFVRPSIDTSPCIFIASAKFGLLERPRVFLNEPTFFSFGASPF